MTTENMMTRQRQAVLGLVEKLGNQPFFLSIQRGLALVLPLVMVGALGLMLRDFPLPAFQRLLAATLGQTWRMACDNLIAGSFGVASLAVLCTMSGAMADISNQRHANRFVSPIMAAAVVLSCFFVVTAPPETTSWRDLFSLDRGLLVASCVAVIGVKLFLGLARWRLLQLPIRAVGDDPVVRDVLTVMPAAMVTILIFGLGRWLLVASGITDLHGAMRHLLVGPCVTSGDSVCLGLSYAGLSQLFWFFGAHGPNMLFSIEDGILVPAGLANAAMAAVGAPPPYILTKAFFDAFTRMGGSGCTLCLIFAVLVGSRDSGNRKLCLFALLPALCNVNEPLLFGIPLVLNPVYLIPFLVTPVLQTLSAYGATVLDLVPRTVANATWTTPALISGFAVTGSLAGPVMQLVNLALGAACYFPFVRLAERLRERQGKRVMEALLQAALGCGTGPGGWKCLDRPGEEGRIAKALANDLDRALARGGELYLEYQPQIDVSGSRAHGVEALLRWRHPLYGRIPPPLTVALAEDAGSIDRLGLYVLTEACVQRAAWKGLVADDLTISVNVSPRQLLDPFFARKVQAALEASRLAPSLLVVEITESMVLEPNARTLATLRRVRETGVGVAIDDFGMGHASLRYLREFPVDSIKIDRSLVLAGSDGVNGHIVRSIVELSRCLGIMTVVEGVEQREQLEQFLELGCETFQGYLFCRPVSGKECLAYLRQWPAKRDAGAARDIASRVLTSGAGIPTTT